MRLAVVSSQRTKKKNGRTVGGTVYNGDESHRKSAENRDVRGAYARMQKGTAEDRLYARMTDAQSAS